MPRLMYSKPLQTTCPSLLLKHHASMRVIFAIDKPIVSKVKSKNFLRKLQQKINKPSLTDLRDDPTVVIDATQKTDPIGVSLDMTQGFVEAGTVAYVTAQLTYAKISQDNTPQFIHLYGVDLLNTDQPFDFMKAEMPKPHANWIKPSKIALCRRFD